VALERRYGECLLKELKNTIIWSSSNAMLESVDIEFNIIHFYKSNNNQNKQGVSHIIGGRVCNLKYKYS
jgi:hypothetical protein